MSDDVHPAPLKRRWEIHRMSMDHAILDSCITVTKIKQERTIQDRIEIGPFFDFRLHYSIFLFEILNIASQLICEDMPKISSKNIEKCRRKSTKGPFMVLS